MHAGRSMHDLSYPRSPRANQGGDVTVCTVGAVVAMQIRAARFHEHIDVCKQCEQHPFALCEVGRALLEGTAVDSRARCEEKKR